MPLLKSLCEVCWANKGKRKLNQAAEKLKEARRKKDADAAAAAAGSGSSSSALPIPAEVPKSGTIKVLKVLKVFKVLRGTHTKGAHSAAKPKQVTRTPPVPMKRALYSEWPLAFRNHPSMVAQRSLLRKKRVRNRL